MGDLFGDEPWVGVLGKEGPHLTMTGASHVFSRVEVPVCINTTPAFPPS